MSDIQTFVTTVKVGLQTITGLRVYEGPVSAVNEFPCAIIEDHTPVAQYTVDSEEGAYFLTITLLLGGRDDQEAWDDLDPYLSARGTQSIRAAVDVIGGPNMSYVHVISASGRQKIKYAGAWHWGSVLVVEGRPVIS